MLIYGRNVALEMLKNSEKRCMRASPYSMCVQKVSQKTTFL